MNLGESIYQAFLAENAGRLRSPRQRLAVIERFVSSAVLDAAGLGRGSKLGRSFSNLHLYEAFHMVERDRDVEGPNTTGSRRHKFPTQICDEAAEVLYALGLLASLRFSRTRTAGNSAAFGRVCEYCWRTEARPRKVGLYGKCHIHAELPAPLPGLPEADEQRDTRLSARDEADKARRLIAAAPPDTLKKSEYPVLPRRPVMPIPSDKSWREFVTESFPLSAAFALGVSENSLLTFVDTVTVLEGRPLTSNEVGELTEPERALPPLQRCEAWLGLLEELFRRRRNTVRRGFESGE